jgi:pilus assembly protein CpaB
MLLLRRGGAAILVATALVLAVRSHGPAGEVRPVVVAIHELSPGSQLHPSDVQQRQWPAGLVPAMAVRDVSELDGKVLAGAASAGEPLTTLRLAGPELARQAVGDSNATSVPIRLADADVAKLLTPGQRVDVITVGEHASQPTVLATGATVLAVLPPGAKSATEKGRLLLVAVPRSVATKLAAATLSQEVTVTLR